KSFFLLPAWRRTSFLSNVPRQRSRGTRQPSGALSRHREQQLRKEQDMPGIKLEHDVWVVVADGEKALFLRNEGDEKYPNLEVFREISEENPPTHDQGTDRPGRFTDGGGNVHKSAVQETD